MSRLLRFPEVQARIGLSRSGIYARVASDPSFPQPVRIGPNSVGFDEDEIEKFIGDRKAARSEPVVASA